MAERILRDLLAQPEKKYISPHDIAVVYGGLDDRKGTFERLSRAYEDFSFSSARTRGSSRCVTNAILKIWYGASVFQQASIWSR
jgi:hypothetical protein